MFSRLSSRLILSFVFALALLLSSLSSKAYDIGDFSFHGFVTQGYLNTAGNNFLIGDSRGGTFDFNEIGLNAFYQPANQSRFYLATQVISRNVGDLEDQQVDFDYALLGINILSDDENQLGIKLGRIKNPYGFYNYTRDVPGTRTGVLLPQSMYFEPSRNDSLRSEGMLLTYIRSGDFGSVTFDWLYGKMAVREKDLFPHDDMDLEYIDAKYRNVFRVMYDLPDNRTRFGFSYLTMDLSGGYEYKMPSYLPMTSELHGKSIYPILSFQYADDDWTITSEYSWPRLYVKTSWESAFIGNGDIEAVSEHLEHFYLEWLYQVRYDISAFVRYERFYFDKKDKEASTYPGVIHPAYSEGGVIGGTWNITDCLSLRSEFYVYEGVANLSGQAVTDDEVDRYWNMFLMQVVYQF